MVKLSFKKDAKQTGLAAIGANEPCTTIKINKKSCGEIHSPSWRQNESLWSIRFRIIKSDIMEDGNPNCAWKWITLKAKFEKEPECRDFLKENIDRILEKYTLDYRED